MNMPQDIPVACIDVGAYRIRMNTRASDELAGSIRQWGLLEPIGVMPTEDRYQLLYGERRLLAVQSLGWKTIRANVHTADAKQALIITLTENIQREQLNPLEEARAYRRLLETGLTQIELAKLIDKTQPYIANKLRLEKLPHGVIALSELGWYTEAHLRQILRIENIVVENGMSAPDPRNVILIDSFQFTRELIAEGKPTNGVIDMVTYWQDCIAWRNSHATVQQLKERIDLLDLQWRDPERYEQMTWDDS